MNEMKIVMKTYKMNTAKGTVHKDGAISSFFHSHFFHFSFLISHLMLLFACSTIDDDMSDCGFEVNYELKLVTNIQTKLQTQLQTDLELKNNMELSTALRTHLESIFRDYADDVDLSFYDVAGDSVRLQHDQHDMNGKEESYTLNIPRRHYQHLATANEKQEQSVDAYDSHLCHESRLSQNQLDTIPSHTAGLFTARYDMDIKDSIDQTFNVHLYMANSATVLVVDTLGSGVRDMKVFATGFATGFHIADSTFIFAQKAPIVRSERVQTPGQQYVCFTTVNFPSREQLVIPVNAPRRASDDGDVVSGLWEYHLYITTRKGTVTRNILRSYEPLNAEQVRVVHVKLEENGSAETVDATMGVSITLDWHEGGTYNPEL